MFGCIGRSFGCSTGLAGLVANPVWASLLQGASISTFLHLSVLCSLRSSCLLAFLLCKHGSANCRILTVGISLRFRSNNVLPLIRTTRLELYLLLYPLFPKAMSDEFAPDTPDSELNSLASLPESATTDSETEDGDRRVSDAEREWKESLQQLELLLTMVVVPYMGKYFGRKCAYWSMFTPAVRGRDASCNRLCSIHGKQLLWRPLYYAFGQLY